MKAMIEPRVDSIASTERPLRKRSHHRQGHSDMTERSGTGSVDQRRHGYPDAIDFALGHLRASSGGAPSRVAFVQALRDSAADDNARQALQAHLYETGPAELADLVAQEFATFPTLALLARDLLPIGHPVRTHLEEVAAWLNSD